MGPPLNAGPTHRASPAFPAIIAPRGEIAGGACAIRGSGRAHAPPPRATSGRRLAVVESLDATAGRHNPTAGRRIPAIRRRDPANGRLIPIIGRRNPIDGRRAPAAGRHRPMAGRCLPVAGRRKPSTGSRDPVAGRRVPAKGRHHPTTGRCYPTPGRREPATGSRHPVAGRQSRKTGRYRVATRSCLAAAGRRHSDCATRRPGFRRRHPGDGACLSGTEGEESKTAGRVAGLPRAGAVHRVERRKSPPQHPPRRHEKQTLQSGQPGSEAGPPASWRCLTPRAGGCGLQERLSCHPRCAGAIGQSGRCLVDPRAFGMPPPPCRGRREPRPRVRPLPSPAPAKNLPPPCRQGDPA